MTLLLMSTLTLAFNILRVYMQSETVLYVDPSTTEVPVQSDFAVDVTVADVVDLYAFGFCLGYNTTVLDILDVLIQRPFESPIIELNENEGYVCITASLPLDYPKLSGTFVLASITFRAAFLGSSILNLYDTILIGSEIRPMPHTTIDGFVTVHAPKLLLETDKDTYFLGENVTILLANIGTETVQIGGYPAWQIYTYPEEKPVYPAIYAFLAWSLDPGKSDTFTWNQYNEFIHTPVEAGMYVVRDTQGWGLSTYLEIVEHWLPYVPHPDQVDLVFWTANQKAYINVTITFGDPCFNISDWGTVIKADYVWVDSEIWHWTGGCILVLWPVSHTYELGYIEKGKYTFTFKSWGRPVKSIDFTIPPVSGDVDLDGIVDIFDLATVGRAYGSIKGEPEYDPDADLNEDGFVDIRDVSIVGRNYGKTW